MAVIKTSVMRCRDSQVNVNPLGASMRSVVWQKREALLHYQLHTDTSASVSNNSFIQGGVTLMSILGDPRNEKLDTYRLQVKKKKNLKNYGKSFN